MLMLNDLPSARTRRTLTLCLVIASGWVTGLAQDPLTLLPNNYKLTFDNADVAVIRAHYGPHEKLPVHDHSSDATVFIYLNDSGAVRIDHAEEGEKPVSVIRPPTVKGSYRIAPGIKERHSIENLGDTSSEFLRVELKHAPIQIKEPFRGKAPVDSAVNTDKIEFTDPGLQIERVICAGPSACSIKASQAPSLVVALSPLLLTSESHGRTRLETGAVQWLPASQSAKIMPGAEPAHILRILLPASR